jgi:thiamine biosynthesis lipoprotein
MIQRLEFHAMGSQMLAIVEGESRPSILAQVPIWFEEWEGALSRFRSDSELSRLNLNAGYPVRVSQALWDVFQASLEAERVTNGLVNPLILDALIYAGYGQSFDLIFTDPYDNYPDLEAGIPSLDQIIADASTRTIFLPKGMHLDFGGVAKGWAAQQAVERLKQAGPALVNAGGDIALSGPRLNGDAWSIGVADPFQTDVHLEFLYLDHGGVATSGRDYHRWMRAGRPQHHIIDPRNGLPAETDILTATVIAQTVTEAEAAAKAVMISGSQTGMAWLDGREGLAGLLVLDTGEKLYSQNLADHL